MVALLTSSGLVLTLGALCFCYRRSLNRILSPHMRKKRPDDEVLKDFVEADGGKGAVMEDLDPELAINPVMRFKIAMSRERANERRRARKGGKGATSTAGSAGALKKLNINLEGKAAKGSKDKPAMELPGSYLKAVDQTLPEMEQEAVSRPRATSINRKVLSTVLHHVKITASAPLSKEHTAAL